MANGGQSGEEKLHRARSVHFARAPSTRFARRIALADARLPMFFDSYPNLEPFHRLTKIIMLYY